MKRVRIVTESNEILETMIILLRHFYIFLILILPGFLGSSE